MAESRRRAVLQMAAGLLTAGLAGCATSGHADSTTVPPSTTTSTTTADATTKHVVDAGERVSLGETLARVSNVAVQESFLYLDTPDSLGVHAADGTQFVFATVASSGPDAPAADELAVAAGGTRHRGDVNASPAPVVDGRGYVYAPGESGGWVLFPLPNPVAGDGARVVWSAGDATVAWRLGDDAAAALSSQPASFRLHRFDLPSSVTPEQSVRVRVVVESTGHGSGVFRAALNQTGPLYASTPVRVAADAGERVEWTHTFDSHVGRDVSELSFSLRLPDDTIERRVTISQ
jgi:hypothetical protein